MCCLNCVFRSTFHPEASPPAILLGRFPAAVSIWCASLGFLYPVSQSARALTRDDYPQQSYHRAVWCHSNPSFRSRASRRISHWSKPRAGRDNVHQTPGYQSWFFDV
ncbi:hypothetical protein CABS03_13709 [Colletotrichum abscissum]|uniref:Uncharacterized protein n=2 Tax=Colletotrichum acutatum species complex TaxID=2707335 RepID=A0A9P9X8V5_9PEZI|nr:hypothetical protein CABS02_10985 [Colletotrichum abscissum]KAK0368711.1 hypothetical protein CLIM01_13932 [Colletotrichum limetticola]